MEEVIKGGGYTLSIGGQAVPPGPAAARHKTAYTPVDQGSRATWKATDRPMPAARACQPGEVDDAIVASMAHVAARCADDLGLGRVRVNWYCELDTADQSTWRRGAETFTAMKDVAQPLAAGFARTLTPNDVYIKWDRWSSARRDPWVLAHTVAHECRHLADYARRPSGWGSTWTKAEQAAADQVAEAHAEDYARSMVAQLWREANDGG